MKSFLNTQQANVNQNVICMSSAKSNALTVLMVGSILLFVWSLWQMIETFVLYSYYYYTTYTTIDVILEFTGTLVLMIGFIMYRSAFGPKPVPAYMTQPMPAAQVQGQQQDSAHNAEDKSQ